MTDSATGLPRDTPEWAKVLNRQMTSLIIQVNGLRTEVQEMRTEIQELRTDRKRPD